MDTVFELFFLLSMYKFFGLTGEQLFVVTALYLSVKYRCTNRLDETNERLKKVHERLAIIEFEIKCLSINLETKELKWKKGKSEKNTKGTRSTSPKKTSN